jgi:methionyl-tRNA synthetase
VPWDSEHVFYVWFDALLNYYSALSYAPAPRAGDAPGLPAPTPAPGPAPADAPAADGGDLTGAFWPASYHVIAKDILRFHAVYWPALLMAAEIELPRHVFVHGYLLMEGEKMSKSLGNVLDPFAVIERYGADALRFYVLRDVPFGQDGSVSTASFELRYESELANELGNLASRTIAMLLRYRDGAVAPGEVDPLLARDFAGLRERVAEHVDRAQLTGALDEIWQRVRRLNRYVEERAPWQIAKDESRGEELDGVLRALAEGLRVVAVLLWPYLPASAERLLGALGANDLSLSSATLDAGRVRRVSALESLYPKGVQSSQSER